MECTPHTKQTFHYWASLIDLSFKNYLNPTKISLRIVLNICILSTLFHKRKKREYSFMFVCLCIYSDSFVKENFKYNICRCQKKNTHKNQINMNNFKEKKIIKITLEKGEDYLKWKINRKVRGRGLGEGIYLTKEKERNLLGNLLLFFCLVFLVFVF